MTTAAKTRHLHAVTGTPAGPAVTGHGGRLAFVAEAHGDACNAALATDVVEQQRELIARAMAALSTPGADFHAVLLDYGRAMFVIGHIDAVTSADTSGPSPVEVGTLAALRILGQHEAGAQSAARSSERVLKAVKS